ncbi:MAG: DUF2225 domain-containing protein [Chitinispirillales bacterium]|jgi:hypothetical protein|nr:DUF2225 domain-containing protein [Chitinispirillales bacterium]
MANRFVVEKLKSLLGSDDLVSMYLDKYGELVNLSYVDQLKEQIKKQQTTATSKKNPENKIGDDPVFEINVHCPACYKQNVVCYNLRAKSQLITESIFLVPQYAGFGEYFVENFNLLQTTVCPECLFASPDPKDWTKVNSITGVETLSQLVANGKLMQELRNQELTRKNAFPAAKADINYFTRPRTAEKAIESIKLSIMRAELEMKSFLPSVYYKIGSYNLKIADIEKKSFKDYKGSLSTAEKYFSIAVEKSDCQTINSEMESIYQVVALNIFLGNLDKAAAFFKIIKDVLKQKELAVRENPIPEAKRELGDVNKWEKRVGILWEYRADKSFWANA